MDENPYLPIGDVLRTRGRIVHSESGGPIRLIITGRKAIPTGRVYSTKASRACPWEGRAERDHLILCEADTDVAHFIAQPHRLEIGVGKSRPLIYFPDCGITRAVGSIEIVEVKRDGQRLKKDYIKKLELARQIYADLGWQFTIITDTEIRREPRFSNAKRICVNQPAVVTAQQTLDALTFVGDRGSPQAQDVARLLGDGPSGWARLHALIIQRLLHIDLNTPTRWWAEAPVKLVHRGYDEGRIAR